LNWTLVGFDMSAERLMWFAITFAARYEFAPRRINTVGASGGDLPDVAAATVRNSGAGLQRAMQRRLNADSVTGRRLRVLSRPAGGMTYRPIR
jgi:hypothetical protein